MKEKNLCKKVFYLCKMILHLDITPRPTPRLTHNMRFSDKAKNYERYKEAVRLLCQSYKYELTGIVKVIFVMPVFESWSEKKRKELIGKPHCRTPDIDNLVKGFMDSFGKDDSHVYEIHARKSWGERGQIILFTGEHL